MPDIGVSKDALRALVGLAGEFVGTTDAAVITTKTVVLEDNTVKQTTPSLGAILVDNGTKVVARARPAANLPLHGNSGGTDIEYSKLEVAGGGTGATTLTGIVKASGTSAFTAVAAPTGAILGDSDTQNITGPKTFSNQAFKQRNPAGTFTLTSIHPAITADKDRRAYQPYNYLVFPEGGTWYVKSGLTEAIDNSSATATTMIQWAIDNLTASRTQKEVVKVIGSPSITKVTIPSYTVLDHTAAKYLQIASTNTAMFENADTTNGNTDIEIIGGYHDGNKANQSSGDELRSMFRFVKCTNVSIHDGKHLNANWHCMRFNDCPTGILVTNNIMGNYRQEGVSDQALNSASGVCHHHMISNNYCYISAGQGSGSCHVAAVNISDLVCVGNLFERNIGGSGITFNGLRNIIANNTVTDIVGAGIVLAQGTGSIWDSSGSIITGNTVKNCGLVGIHVQNAQVASDITISNNFVDTAGTVTVTSAGILLQDVQGFTITGNTCKNNGGSGIYVAGASTIGGIKHGIIANNLCYANGQGASVTGTFRSGIAMSANSTTFCSNISVHGNICYNVTSSFQRWGIRGDFSKDCIIKNNDVRANSTDGITLASDSGTKVYGNLGYLTEASGSSTQSGNASTKVFNIAHGLTAAPTKYLVTPGSADAVGPLYLTSDATNVIVTYPSAPPTGSSNLIFRWVAEVVT